MFLVYPLNIDPLIPFVRQRFGDVIEPYRYSDVLLRTALVQGIQALQRRWAYRYLLYSSGIVLTDPALYQAYEEQYATSLSGFVLVLLPDSTPYPLPSGMVPYDVFRHPRHTFVDANTFVVSQEDVYPIVLAAVITLRLMLLSSSATDFQSWSDGQFSFSNSASQRALSDLLQADRDELDAYFKQRLARAKKGWFPTVL